MKLKILQKSHKDFEHNDIMRTVLTVEYEIEWSVWTCNLLDYEEEHDKETMKNLRKKIKQSYLLHLKQQEEQKKEEQKAKEMLGV